MRREHVEEEGDGVNNALVMRWMGMDGGCDDDFGLHERERSESGRWNVPSTEREGEGGGWFSLLSL